MSVRDGLSQQILSVGPGEIDTYTIFLDTLLADGATLDGTPTVGVYTDDAETDELTVSDITVTVAEHTADQMRLAGGTFVAVPKTVAAGKAFTFTLDATEGVHGKNYVLRVIVPINGGRNRRRGVQVFCREANESPDAF